MGQADEDPTTLVANPANWRTHPTEQRAALRGSLAEVGWVQQVLVNRRTGHVVDGHARLEEALARREPTVPVLYLDLDPAEEALVLASLDPIGAMATTDDDKLRSLLAEVSVGDAGLRALLTSLQPDGRKEGLTDPDDAPEPPASSRLAAGELWQLGDHRLAIGDARDPELVGRLLGEAPVDVLWTDPPYGVAVVGGTADQLRIQNDDISPAQIRELVAGALRLAQLRPGGIFWLASPSGFNHAEFLLALRDADLTHRQTIVWVKDRFVLSRMDFHGRHEAVIVGEQLDLAAKEYEPVLYGWADGAHRFRGGRRLDTVWEIPRPSRSAEHPTMKPVELVARALEYSSLPGDRVCLAVELDPRYAQVIIERWQAFTGRKAERIDG